ncbi:hypothetical protein [Microbacterium sp. CH12i]|uniref:hypothetical protein n=1 Tax=Microbacterium sp. CH12i TaxID=1479651 RepID=UPI0012692EFD|nr:hypothetical protein [Microbacterium sp. CH12i]
MAAIDYGLSYGTEWVCSKQFDHIVADPAHWTVSDLDTAVRVAKMRAGLDPDQKHLPATFIDHMDEEWRMPFWKAQLEAIVAAGAAADVEIGRQPMEPSPGGTDRPGG